MTLESTPPADEPATALAFRLRTQLSSLQGLLALAIVMTDSVDEGHILHVATSSVPSFCECVVGGIYLFQGGWQRTQEPCARRATQDAIEKQFVDVGSAGGALVIDDGAWPWAWGYALRGVQGHLGYFIACARQEPPSNDLFLLRVLVQQTGVALTNARLHASERAVVSELRTTNETLARTVAALERTTAIHERLTSVAGEGKGLAGIATAVHELTGHAVAVEDRHGNLLAWGGPDEPEPGMYGKDPPAERGRVLRDLAQSHGALRTARGFMAAAAPSDDVLGVLVLTDSDHVAGDHEFVALEHGATVLAMELARLRSLDETELRLGRDLVEELLAGTDERGASARARALGYDLQRPHRVVAVECDDPPDDESFVHAVRRAARDRGVGSLLVTRAGSVIVLANRQDDWNQFCDAVCTELGSGRDCRVGVGGPCDGATGFGTSFDEAELALRMLRAAGTRRGASSFDELGVYRILAHVDDPSTIEQFVLEWLGALVDYDELRNAELVLTLSEYLDRGGSYAATAAALAVHRSTLKYRLQRIREISNHDLSDPDTQFTLHLATRAWKTLRALRNQLL